MLTITTLGTWRLERDGGTEPILDSPAKNLALLVYLACSPGATARRERLIDLLWADLDPAAADHALRQIVWLLRRRLGDACLTSGGGTVSLTCPVRSDRTDFLQAIESQNFEAAVALYHGDFLPGFGAPGGAEFEKWADLERRRLLGQFLLASEALARHWMAAGRLREAVTIAQRARDADRDHEASWRLLLEALRATGDIVSAAVEAEEFVRHLAADDRQPDPASAAAIRDALNQPAVQPEGPRNPILVTELVGRERPFTAITAAWDAARTGQTRHVHVIGAAGLGKTRLLHDAAARLHASGAVTVVARANPGERLVSFALAADLAAALADKRGAAAVAPATAEALVALNPKLSNRYPAAVHTPARGEDTLRVATLALAELVESVADEAPLALLIDDVHWADPDSRQLLIGLLPRLPARVLLVTASRPGVEGPLERAGSATLSLEPLGLPDVALLLASGGALPDAEWASGLPAALHRATLGSPLLILESLRLALSRELLQLGAERWSSERPVELYALLAAGGALHQRIAELPRDPAWLLTLLATAGVPVHQRLLCAAVARAESAIIENLQELDRLGIVVRAGDQWSAAHDEIADRALALATAEQRTAAHAALGRALLAESGAAESIRRAAQHLAAASLDHELGMAATRWTRAARTAGDARQVRLILAELLGTQADDALVHRVLMRLPWRIRLPRRASAAAAALAILMLASAGLVAWPRLASDDPGVVFAVWREEHAGVWRLYSRELTAADVRENALSLASLQRQNLTKTVSADAILRPGKLLEILIRRAFDDSGGVDLELVSASGRARRLTRVRGDDFGGSWSPDGRAAVISTDRWSNASQSDLAIIDPVRPDSVLVRLTKTPYAREVSPLWSPDGSRIAFNRNYHYGDSLGLPRLCVVTVDGVQEQCLTTTDGPALVAWASAVELVLASTDTVGVARLFVMNLSTGARREVAEGGPVGTVRIPGWIACLCRRDASEPYQTMLIPVHRPERSVRVVPGETPPELGVFPAVGREAYVQRIQIESPGGAIPVDVGFRLRLLAWDTKDRPVEPQAVRWWTSDTTMATVDNSGELRPRRAGPVVVYVTSGGWRTDSLMVQIAPGNTRLAISESWMDGIQRRWIPFGTPAPLIARHEGASVLVPNGDSTHLSGVLSRLRLATREGIGLELVVSMPITEPQWQTLIVDLKSADSLAIETWDMITGDLQFPVGEWRTCGVGYPGSTGIGYREWLRTFSGGIQSQVRAPAGTAAGRWITMRLQFFPDGRCAVAINGRAVAISDRRVPMGDSAIIMIGGFSHRTTMRIGRVDAWLGVRNDINWAEVAQR